MLIIFEGLDGSGKTTFAKELSKHSGIPYMKPMIYHKLWLLHQNIKGWDEPIIDLTVTDMARILNCDIILDRSLLSVIIYQIYHGKLSHLHAHDMLEYWVHSILPVDSVCYFMKRDLEKCKRTRINRFSPSSMGDINNLYNQWILELKTLGAQVEILKNIAGKTPQMQVEKIYKEASWNTITT
jgi:hypothetical protein